MSNTCIHVRKLLQILLYVFAFVLPLSIVLAEPVAFFATACWIVLLFYGPARLRLRRCPFCAPILLFGGLALLCSFTGLRPDISLAKCHRLILMAIVFMLDYAFRDEKGITDLAAVERCVLLFIAGTTFLAGYDLVRIPAIMAGGTSLYDAGNMRDPQFYLVSVGFLGSFFLFSSFFREARAWWLVLAMNLLGLVLHFKRGVWIAAVLALIFLAAISRKWKAALGIVLFACLMILLPPVHNRLAQLGNEFSEIPGGRYALWTRVAPHLLSEYPWGMGYAATKNIDFQKYFEDVQPRLNHLHNNLLQVAVEMGWLGAITWIAWMTITCVMLIRAIPEDNASSVTRAWLSKGLLCGFFGLMIQGLFEYNLGDSEILMLFCFIMGLSSLLQPTRPNVGVSI